MECRMWEKNLIVLQNVKNNLTGRGVGKKCWDIYIYRSLPIQIYNRSWVDKLSKWVTTFYWWVIKHKYPILK